MSLVPDRYIRELVARLGDKLRWTPHNRDTDASAMLILPNGYPIMLMRKRTVGPTGPVQTYRCLSGGITEMQQYSLEDITNFLQAEPRKTRR